MKFKIWDCDFEISPLFTGMIAFSLIIDQSGWMGPLLLAMLTHEAGHIVIMAILDCLPVRVCLRPFEINMETPPRCVGRLQEGLLALGGIAANACMGLCGGVSGNINLFLAIFHLLPLYSMDGYQFLTAILPRTQVGQRTLLGISAGFSLAAVIGGLGMLICFRSPMLILFSLYVLMVAVRDRRRLKVAKSVEMV